MSAFSIDTFPEALEAAHRINADIGNAEVCTCADEPHQNAMHDLAVGLAENYPAMVKDLTAGLRALHRVREVKAITYTDCVRQECDHEDGCPTQPVETCAHCWDIAERANMYFAEAGIPEEVLWPCRTKEALDALERGGEQ